MVHSTTSCSHLHPVLLGYSTGTTWDALGGEEEDRGPLDHLVQPPPPRPARSVVAVVAAALEGHQSVHLAAVTLSRTWKVCPTMTAPTVLRS